MQHPEPLRVDVDLGERSYSIWIGANLIDSSELLKKTVANRNVVVMTDDNVGPLYADRLLQGAARTARSHAIEVMPHGEINKTLATMSRVLDRLVASGAQRDAVLMALGGGVVGDIGGFAAACYMRGIDFIQVPTTLLAQVDSSVGGKTGVNHPSGKNLIGAFHQPRAVLIDITTLETLPDREYAAGLAETVKYGVIDQPAFFDWMEQQAEALAGREQGALIEAVRRACEAKAAVVRRDEREQGARALLNLGHTFGHAIETQTGYERFLHGEAVAIGMGLAADLAVLLKRCDGSVPRRLRSLLERFGLPTRLPSDLPAQALWGHMQLDKKNRAGQVRLIIPEAVGRSVIDDRIPAAAVIDVLVANGAAA